MRLLRERAHQRLGGDRAPADTPPATVVPGMLAQHVRTPGCRRTPGPRRRATARRSSRPTDRGGGAGRRWSTRRGGAAVAAWARPLLVAMLPTGPNGRGRCAGLLAARPRADLVFVVQQPNACAAPARGGAAGLPGRHHPAVGLDAHRRPRRSTDFAPTVLERLGLPSPTTSRRADRGERAPRARDLSDCAIGSAISGPRRWARARLGLLGALADRGLVAGRRGARALRARAAAGGALAAGVLLAHRRRCADGAASSRDRRRRMPRSRSLTDRLLPWPRAIALPAAVTVGAHVVDLRSART